MVQGKKFWIGFGVGNAGYGAIGEEAIGEDTRDEALNGKEGKGAKKATLFFTEWLLTANYEHARGNGFLNPSPIFATGQYAHCGFRFLYFVPDGQSGVRSHRVVLHRVHRITVFMCSSPQLHSHVYNPAGLPNCEPRGSALRLARCLVVRSVFFMVSSLVVPVSLG